MEGAGVGKRFSRGGRGAVRVAGHLACWGWSLYLLRRSRSRSQHSIWSGPAADKEKEQQLKYPGGDEK